MALLIQQQPLYDTLPIGQQIIFTVSDPTIVALKYKVKYVAQVHVSNLPINLSNNNALIGTFKTTPNNAGVGIFDLRPILETFVKPDHEPQTTINANSDSEYKGTKAQNTMFPIHLMDKFAISKNSIKRFAINFFIEYSDSATGAVIDFTDLDPTASESWKMFNGVLQYDDVLDVFQDDYGYNMNNYFFDNTWPIPSAKSFLSTAPAIQYARLEDYGTVSFFNYISNTQPTNIYQFEITYYYSGGSSSETVLWENNNGGTTSAGPLSNTRLGYFGAYPANLQNWSATFAAAVVSGLTHYTVEAQNSGGFWIGKYLTINILCPETKGYEGVRLTWLNKWGTWDYYTFNMKSTRSVTTNRTSYTQLGGTWNDGAFKIAGYKGGKKNFRVNSTEKIKLNTDFVTEAEGVWFEQLINSPEVYVLEGFQSDGSFSSLNNYVQPATITTSSYIRKTIANDRLMQYTFEIEKSKMKRTQAV
tara:strand:- start:5539 stop:6960 length:1422 start_codon:yes stop_codon:yes gene_type:complete